MQGGAAHRALQFQYRSVVNNKQSSIDSMSATCFITSRSYPSVYILSDYCLLHFSLFKLQRPMRHSLAHGDDRLLALLLALQPNR